MNMGAAEARMKNVWKVAMVMVVVVTALAAATVLYKLAILDGMNFAVINAYRFIFATIFMVPLACLYERKKMPRLTWKVFFMTFLCGLFGGTLFQNLYLESLVLTSATFASASFNLIPAITFILAISFRLEKLNLGKAAGKAKILGTLTGIGGAMVMTFLKGTEINIWSSHMHPRQHHNANVAHQNAEFGQRILGAVCAFGSCFSYASWLIIQGKMSASPKEYPSHYTNTALMSTMAAIQSTVFALCIQRDWSQWKLGSNIRLITVLFSGIVASGVMVIAIAWCVGLRGPLFVSSFNPLLVVIVAIAGSLVLDENLYVGSVVGAVLIVGGLYMVLWGKGKEAKTRAKDVPLPLQSSQQSLVHDQSDHSIAKNNEEDDEASKEKQEGTVSSNV